MLSLTHINIATIILDTSAVIIACGILGETRFMRRSGRKADVLFFRLLLLTMVLAVSDIGGYITENRADPLLVKIQLFSMSLFYLTFVVLSMSWFDYCLYKFKNEQREPEGGVKAVHIPGMITFAVIILNIFTGIIFQVDDRGGYHRNFLFIPMYLVLICYIAAGFVMVGKYRTVRKKKLIPLWLYVMPVLLSIVITFFVGEVSMAAIGTAISIAFTHLGTMNEVAEISIRETGQ
ncbi:MAG: hypothetical protein K5985_07860 [Lachnospiraceae bacterium]|nr:hypothetical protein [Lachnospiraceae bacterium]